MTKPTPVPDRRNPRLSDMVRSVVLLLAVVAVIGLVRSFLRTDQATPVATFDYLPYAAQAQSASDYTLAFPETLPDGWRATSARFSNADGTTWHLGILTPEQEYVGVEQTDASPRVALETYVPGTESAGTAEINGEPWGVRTFDEEDRIALVRTDKDVTTLVIGTTDEATLEEFAATLPH